MICELRVKDFSYKHFLRDWRAGNGKLVPGRLKRNKIRWYRQIPHTHFPTKGWKKNYHYGVSSIQILEEIFYRR